MSWTDGKPFTATHEHCNTAPWGWGKPGENFRCGLCGYKFAIGDTVRWQFTNDSPGAGGNPFVCVQCDTGKDGIVAEIRRRRADSRAPRNWWFVGK